jgi:hypothetical protein
VISRSLFLFGRGLSSIINWKAAPTHCANCGGLTQATVNDMPSSRHSNTVQHQATLATACVTTLR